MADGFSCREMIEQNTDRQGLHLAQVLQMALRDEKTDLTCPEVKYVDNMKGKDGNRRKKGCGDDIGLICPGGGRPRDGFHSKEKITI